MKCLKETQIFTPKWAIEEMLDLLDKDREVSVFNDESVFFFEPTCGDGAMLIPLLERVFNSRFKQTINLELALCEAIFCFYAVELDESICLRARLNVLEWASSKKQLNNFEKAR